MADFSPAGRLEGVRSSRIRAVLDKARAMERAGRPVISFSVGEPDFDTPQPIKDGTCQALLANRTHYCSNRGVLELRQAVAGLMKSSSGLSYDPEEEILITTGGAEALHHALWAFVGPGDEVIILTPAFISYENVVRLCGARPVLVPCRPENGFQPDLDEVARHVTVRTRMIVVNNPCNPSGAVFPQELLAGLARLAERHNLLVLSDEIYSRLIYGGSAFCSMAGLPGMRERTLLVNGFSKTYAMTGWRVGYVSAPKELVSSMVKVHQYTTASGNTFVQEGLARGLADPATETAVRAMLQSFARRRELVVSGLQKISGLTFVRPQGAFYALVSTEGTGLSGEWFAADLLERCGVAVVPAGDFGPGLENFFRLSFAASESAIVRGLEKIRGFVESIARR
ncbi:MULTISPECIES: pyridoxal phosphate-dependent aminotransferase [Jonquetella]|uniref:pyridoxal phosphate-dependent aminotransferase n=1 Tax=Jonquetella TaxID=428711 RepID=UPI0001B9109A|nr:MULTISPECIES: pyridoxal phosphate-dependent aminotransferase [Jonquetella]EEX48135.1 aminotransferase, class I/II [Jonquetella anthropi E3_33 E1]ERL24520.1 aminotransferase, class I/II [Jonquetella sp. BV3C21]